MSALRPLPSPAPGLWSAPELPVVWSPCADDAAKRPERTPSARNRKSRALFGRGFFAAGLSPLTPPPRYGRGESGLASPLLPELSGRRALSSLTPHASGISFACSASRRAARTRICSSARSHGSELIETRTVIDAALNAVIPT